MRSDNNDDIHFFNCHLTEARNKKTIRAQAYTESFFKLIEPYKIQDIQLIHISVDGNASTQLRIGDDHIGEIQVNKFLTNQQLLELFYSIFGLVHDKNPDIR